jgi:16S rRNA (cytosine1402-N4)-methyltransferase
VSAHAPVLLDETVAALAPRAGGVYCDCTLGRGGHARAILDAAGPEGRLIGIDRDPASLAETEAALRPYGPRVQLVHGRFSEVRRHLDALGVGLLDGLTADLGVSSPQLDRAERGFSFQKDGPLDMRMDPSRGPSAREAIHDLSERELADVIYELGEERRSRPIARAIKQRDAEGRLETTADLREAIVTATGERRGPGIDPATRTFQALRLFVNDELGELDRLLDALGELLAPGGVVAIISFHSLEDRAVKRAFTRDLRLVPLTKKPITASDAECARNPRARSAKLRAARRTSEARA